MDLLLMFITILFWPHLGSPQSWKIRSSVTLQGGDDIIKGKVLDGSKENENEYKSEEYESDETALNSLRADDETSQTKKNEPSKYINNIINIIYNDFYQKIHQFVVQMIENLHKLKDTTDEEEDILMSGKYKLPPKRKDKGYRHGKIKRRRSRKDTDCIGHFGCCTQKNPCKFGGGGCDLDNHCEGDLICGVQNCKNIRSGKKMNCCKNKGFSGPKPWNNIGCIGSSEQFNCCTQEYPCKLGGGDCARDQDCEGELICGRRNCQDFRSDARSTFDCCTDKRVPLIPEGFGDCDINEDCEGSLVCGENNCQDFQRSTNPLWFNAFSLIHYGSNFDCCMQKNCTGNSGPGCQVSAGGQCRRHNDCKGYLICIRKNRKKKEKEKLCAKHKRKFCKGLKGQGRCCTKNDPCKFRGGNCRYDSDCKGKLVCGENNCQDFHKNARRTFNCCKKGKKERFHSRWLDYTP